MKLVGSPGVVCEEGVRAEEADLLAQLAAQIHGGKELAIRMAQVDDIIQAQDRSGLLLLCLTLGDHLARQRRSRRGRVSRALVAARHQHKPRLPPLAHPGGHRPRTAQLEIIRMGADH